VVFRKAYDAIKAQSERAEVEYVRILHLAASTMEALVALAEQLVRRLVDAGHEDILPLLLETFELEVGDRRERRIDRLRRASRLPPGKTFETLEDARLPKPLMSKFRELRRGEFLDRLMKSKRSSAPVQLTLALG